MTTNVTLPAEWASPDYQNAADILGGTQAFDDLYEKVKSTFRSGMGMGALEFLNGGRAAEAQNSDERLFEATIAIIEHRGISLERENLRIVAGAILARGEELEAAKN